MEITEVRISPSKGGKVQAFASVVFDDCFIVNDIRVMAGKEGQLFITMPARRSRGGQFRDIAHPLNTETRQEIEDAVLAEYRTAVESAAVPEPSTDKDASEGVLSRLAGTLFSDDFWLTADDRESDG